MYRYVLTDQLGELAVEPLGSSDFIITWAKEQEGSLRDYVKTFDGNIVFTGSAFNRLLKLEQSIYRCNTQYLSIEKQCQGEWQEIFNGGISLSSGEWNLDRCSVKLNFIERAEASCLIDKQAIELNLLSIYPKHTLNTKPANISYEFLDFDDSYSQTDQPVGVQEVWDEPGDPTDGGWRLYRHTQSAQLQNSPTEWVIYARSFWIREVILIPTGAPSPGLEWIFVSSSGGQDKYARQANLYNYQFREEYPSPNNQVISLEYDYIGKDSAYNSIRNGVKLVDVLELFVDEFCPGMVIVSDFFQINPDFMTSVNYVTEEESKVLNIFLFQASDVKRPTATGSATIANFDWERLTIALKNLFNVEYQVKNGVLRLEHVSYFSQDLGLDLTTEEFKKYMSGKRVYSYKTDEIPAKETWSFPTAQSSGDFNGVPIIYNNGCVVNKKLEKNYAVEDVYTDIELAFANPGSDSQIVKDEAIFFVAAGWDGSSYYILQEPGILSRPRINNTLALAQLHRDYFKHERALPAGLMNNVLTQFKTVVPTKLGVKFAIPFCCPNDFNPNDLVKTPLGIGSVNSAAFNFKSNMLELELLYDAFSDLEENTEPVAVFDVVNTYDNSTILIDVLANDTYKPGDTIEIVQPPALGTAAVVSGKIQYFVNLGAAGSTYLTYRVKDNEWGSYSNTVSVTINILAENQPPIANTDNYQAVKDEVLTVAAAQGVLANDSDDYGGLFIADYDSATAQGGSVNMASNGSFTYTPPASYTGSDSFNYTVEDSGGLQDVGVVNISVDAANVPITAPDNYTVQAGATLVIDNSPGKPNLKSNDYTPDSSPFSIQAQTVTSSRGVAVPIENTGNFTYIAPGTPGVDSFTYTANGVGGSATGTATVNVLPVIKVRAVERDLDVVFEPITCGASVRDEAIRRDIADVYLEFLDASDNPVDVTGMGLKVKVKATFTDELDSNNDGLSFPVYNIPGGTDYLIQSQLAVFYRVLDCDNETVVRQRISYEVEPGDGYTAI